MSSLAKRLTRRPPLPGTGPRRLLTMVPVLALLAACLSSADEPKPSADRPETGAETGSTLVLEIHCDAAHPAGLLSHDGRVEEDIEGFLKKESTAALAKAGRTRADIDKAGYKLPVLVVLRCDLGAPFHIVNRVITGCEGNGFHNFALRSASRAEKGTRQPPPKVAPTTPAAKAPDNKEPSGGKKPSTDSRKVETLIITVSADASGDASEMIVGQSLATNLGELKTCIAAAFRDENHRYEKVILQANPRLRFDRLMQIVNICARQRLPNGEKLETLSFVELPETEEKK
ncbi:MAG: hypothetical protein ACLQLG_05205 [Thermoguttaceae bacterium]